MKKILTKKGFTLIELIVVIGILAVLAVVLIPSIMNYVGEAREARNTANARALYSEVSADVAMNGMDDGDEYNETRGGVSCDYEVESDVITAFSCTIADDGDGLFEEAAATMVFVP